MSPSLMTYLSSVPETSIYAQWHVFLHIHYTYIHIYTYTRSYTKRKVLRLGCVDLFPFFLEVFCVFPSLKRVYWMRRKVVSRTSLFSIKLFSTFGKLGKGDMLFFSHVTVLGTREMVQIVMCFAVQG